MPKIVIGDLEDLEKDARAGRPGIVANSHAAGTAERLGPAPDAGRLSPIRPGWAATRTWVGYRGTRQALFDFANLMLRQHHELEPYQSIYRAEPRLGDNHGPRRLQLVWSIKEEPAAVLRVAFASTDRSRVNQHFGAAEGFAIYEVVPDKATLVGVADFPEEAMDGNENKLAAKVEFSPAATRVLRDGHRRLGDQAAHGQGHPADPHRRGWTPSRAAGRDQPAMKEGGVQWIDRAIAAQTKSEDRFSEMEDEGWQG